MQSPIGGSKDRMKRINEPQWIGPVVWYNSLFLARRVIKIEIQMMIISQIIYTIYLFKFYSTCITIFQHFIYMYFMNQSIFIQC